MPKLLASRLSASGYIYAILKQMSIGKYIAPTSARTLIQGKVPVNISQRRSGSHNNSIHGYGQNVNSFLKTLMVVMRS